MNKPEFFKRGELTATLWAFRREFLIVGILSFLSNLLMLAPTIYMLQVFDRVLVSQSELTLVAVSLADLLDRLQLKRVLSLSVGSGKNLKAVDLRSTKPT